MGGNLVLIYCSQQEYISGTGSSAQESASKWYEDVTHCDANLSVF